MEHRFLSEQEKAALSLLTTCQSITIQTHTHDIAVIAVMIGIFQFNVGVFYSRVNLQKLITPNILVLIIVMKIHFHRHFDHTTVYLT